MPKSPKKPREKTLKVCPLCKTDEESWHIKKYYISLDSILFMCENLECLYPFHDEAIFDASLKRLKVPVYVDNSVTTSSSAGASSSTSATTTTTTTVNANANAAAEPAKEENESTQVAEPTPEESTEEDEESTAAAEPSLAESTEAAEPALAESTVAILASREFSPVHPHPTSIAQTSAVDTTSTTQSFLEFTWQACGQTPTPTPATMLPPTTASSPPVTKSVEAASSPLISESSCQSDVPAAALTPKRKRSRSEDADVEDDLVVDEPSHKRRSRSLERAFAVTPPPSAFDWSGASPSTSPHLTSDSSEPSSPLFNQHSLGYISDDSWTHPSTPTDSKGFSGIDMSNLYVPPSNVNETGAEDDLSKMLFADIPTDMADLQAFSSQLAFGQLDQGDDLDQLLLLQMDANNL